MIEVIVKDNELQIYVNREKLALWLAGKGDVPWEVNKDTGSPEERERKAELQQHQIDKKAEEIRIEHEKNQGFKDSEGTTKEFPNPVDSKDVEEVDGSHVNDRDIGEEPDSIDLFEEGPNGIGGTLQDDPKAKDKMKAMKDWLKAEKFNYKNFCVYLYQLETVAGFKLSTPLIGLTQKKEPSMFQLATRYYSYWLSAKDEISNDYKNFLIKQLQDLGITIADAKGNVLAVFDGSEEIDPKNLPKGVEVGV
jgi:hypothetical protein